ncbi:bifunctional phosphoserine phosphatase/homoserine phosphotransferase ThrH [Gammaproteobacteria bacterium]|nr:bifunctional phosphoserine phosphatase/homoserine phosphotransferase ThrH [Gammaproteobacteria bacterium]MDB2678105.1 bifunctional phosphoserine phosphatase/homoserine phosphotransferase ThrH [Gammaproteobacteria bacterium]MDC3228858.1 bifunctional phosphoserine phosphatase/homoserine phosphotransferase ThrH [Gammaproteobacteria bacterium]MDG1062603.1 bifunctional phosphoserine phosphatase/homoserine phosphotransferase ThrH [SAR86 cluster bacterium]
MDIVCFDMEGTLTPEIWEQVAFDSGIAELSKTTRDIPSYSDLMDYRIEIMNQHNLKLADIISATKKLDLLDGALEFLNQVRKEFQVVILSDTFHEIAYPLMEKLGYPLLLCHTLNVDAKDNILGYKLRDLQAKKQAILGFQSMGYRCLAAGDSFNDLQMFEVADQGFFINAPKAISSSMPEIPSFNEYSNLLSALRNFN